MSYYAKKQRWVAKAQKEIKAVNPKRRGLDFDPLHVELTDTLFEMQFTKIFLDIRNFVSSTFDDFPFLTPGSLWSEAAPESFYNLVRQVARPGSQTATWEGLLRDSLYRCSLIQGVLMMALHVHVFSSLCFGAAKKHLAMLSAEDVAMVDIEGFQRTKLRAETNRVYLKANGGMPPFFWQEVDKLATQITHMLLPVYAAISLDPEVDGYNPIFMYQAVHDIVARAAWTTNAMRISPKVTTIEWVTPGEAFSYEQVCIVEEKTVPGQESPAGKSRVMLSIAPAITRHSPETQGLVSGRTQYAVLRAHVACYTGKYGTRDDARAMVPLKSHLRRVRRSSVPGGSSFFMVIMMIIGLFVFMMMYRGGKYMAATVRHLQEKTPVENLSSKFLLGLKEVGANTPAISIKTPNLNVGGFKDKLTRWKISR